MSKRALALVLTAAAVLLVLLAPRSAHAAGALMVGDRELPLERTDELGFEGVTGRWILSRVTHDEGRLLVGHAPRILQVGR